MSVHPHPLAFVAAKVFSLYCSDDAVFAEANNSVEPFRCLMDRARDRGLHSIEDGSSDYHLVLDGLDALFQLDQA